MSGQRRKRRSEAEIHAEILCFLGGVSFPCTTEEIARTLGLNWYAATTHLTKLKAEGRVFHKRVGKQNEWWPEDVRGQRKRIQELEKIIEKQDKIIKKQDKRIQELESKIRDR